MNDENDASANAQPAAEHMEQAQGNGQPSLGAAERHQGGDPTVVGIGASAGGLAALRKFFAEVPPDSGLAFVVVVHLSPEHESHLPELLQPFVKVPVSQVVDTTLLEPNHVYVIPPNRNLTTIDTHVRLDPLEQGRHRRAPIDHFLRTLAETHDGNAVAVILTGTGSDGALGVKEVKERGGLTIVQTPSDADYDGMPQSAIATGLVDLVLPVREIPHAIMRFAGTEPLVAVPDDGDDLSGEDEQLLQRMFGQIRARTGRDFSRYKRSTIMRRVRRRMQLRSVNEFAVYLDRLRTDTDEMRVLADELLVTVSSFFRDPAVFAALERDVIPQLFAEKTSADDIRVWSVGCATGEEPYSLTMLLLEEAARHDSPPRIQVFASDLHEPSLERARKGFYPGDIETDVTLARLERFFRVEDGGYRIRDDVRELVVFAPHNLLGDPPFSRLDLITCRNVLIYVQRDVQQDVVQLFHYALNSNGWLVLGTPETVGATELFRVENKEQCIYRKRNVPVGEPRLPVFAMARLKVASDPERPERRTEPISYKEAHQRMLERRGPASLLVAPDDRVVHLSDKVGRYLLHPAGEITTNVLKLIRSELVIELRAGLHTAREHRESWKSEPVLVRFDGESSWVVISVEPSREPDEDGFALVVFDELERELVSPRSDKGVAEGNTTDAGALVARARQFENQRDLARQRLQAIIEEYETSQEHLKASNEELQSANEELRSTLEELETSKEELQSMNEELQTVNQENRHKVEELAQLSSDLQNLLSATNIATLFLDRELRILRFTPGVTDLFNVRTTDRGRPISDLTHRLGYPELATDAAEVLRRLIPIEREVRDESGRPYLARVLAYRSSDDRIEGIVITFVDITTLKRAEEALRASEQRMRHVTDAVPSVLFTATADGRVDFISGQLVALTGALPDDVVGTLMWPALIHPDDRVDVEAAWRASVATATGFETRYRLRNDDTHRWVMVRANPVVDDTGTVTQWFGTITDINALVEAERELQLANELLEQRVEDRTRQVRQLASTLAMAEQEERRRLGQILHDDLQQQLYSIQLKIDFAREDLRTENRDEVLRSLADAEERVVQAIEITRNLTIESSPPLLTSDGLLEAFGWLVSRMRTMYGISVDVVSHEPVPVADEGLRVLLFQVTRELLFNVAKHAETDRAIVEVQVFPDRAVLRVRDDGRGFDPEADLHEDGRRFGLYSIRDRIGLIGGEVDVDSRPGGGTTVTVVAPLTPRATATR